MMKKSMISVAAAAVLVTSFTGCNNTTTRSTTDVDSNDTSISTSTSTTSGISNHINTPTGTVTGSVVDTNGIPLAGVKVFVAGQEARTDAGGVYTVSDVAVTNTRGTNNKEITSTLPITIAAPTINGKDYLGATVTVTPQAQQISSGDSDTAMTTTNSSPNTNFIDGYLVSAGTVTLPKLNGKVKGVFENAANGERLKGIRICLDLNQDSLSLGLGNNNALQTSGTVHYATPSFCTFTTEGGKFEISDVASDISLRYQVANWTVSDQQGFGSGATVTVRDTVVTNIGELSGTHIVVSDNINPRVVSITGQIDGSVSRVMLEDDIRNNFVVNFSEILAFAVDFPDNDFTKSVIVKAGPRGALRDINVTKIDIGANKRSIIITLASDLKKGEDLDINLLITDFKDTAGNFLALNPAAAVNYDVPRTQIVRLQAQIFQDLNTKAPAVTDKGQLTEDTRFETIDDNDAGILSTIPAFNDVYDANQNNIISQLNARGSAVRLQKLGRIAVNTLTVLEDEARIIFTPSEASRYRISYTSVNGSNDITPKINPTKIIGATLMPLTSVEKYVEVVASSKAPIEMVIERVNSLGDKIVITPLDDLGYAGTFKTITLTDKVEPTTVIQRAYNIAGARTTVGGIVSFGEGGELSKIGEVSAGTPYLPITACLLDNLTATGAVLNGRNSPDYNYEKELFIFNKDIDNTDPAEKISNAYDSTAYPLMNTSRIVGVAFSENISGTTISPKYNGTSGLLTKFEVNNDVSIDDNHINGVNNVDLIDMSVSNVITLATKDHNSIIDYAGIKDVSGNTATVAKVVIQDKMPPFVTKAGYDGTTVSITFNEVVTLRNEDKFTIGGNNLIAKVATYHPGSPNYVLSNDKKTLDISIAEFPNLTRLDFDLGTYSESAYKSGTKQHAKLLWTIGDIYGNNWITPNNCNITPPAFLIADLVGPFIPKADNTNFNANAQALPGQIVAKQSVSWSLTHPIDTTSQAGRTLFLNGNSESRDVVIAGVFRFNNDIRLINNDIPLINATVTLSRDGTVVTLSFDKPASLQLTATGLQNAGIVSLVNFASKLDPDAKANLTASANNK